MSTLKFIPKANLLFNKLRNQNFTNASRCISTSLVNNCDADKKTWFSKFLTVRNIEAGTEAHSKLLADPDAIYELQVHDVQPDKMEQYLKICESKVNELQGKEKNTELVASFRVEIGNQDQCVNIWRYKNGYPTATKAHELLKSDKTLINLTSDEAKLLRKRENQLMAAFGFWGKTEPAVRNCNYEMRTYILKPGTMIEWGNNWARGIHYRQNKVAGYFSQLGQLYIAHHIWHYDDLQARKDVRESAWRKSGWDEIVAGTVPLIREMRSKWMVGNSFSPIR